MPIYILKLNMYSLLFTTGILFSLTFCHCQKLVCDGKNVDDDIENFDYVLVFFKRPDFKDFDPTDLQKFDPTRKTIFIIHGLPTCELSFQWVFEMGEKWLQWVNQFTLNLQNV